MKVCRLTTTISCLILFIVLLSAMLSVGQSMKCDPASKADDQYINRAWPEWGYEWLPAHCYNFTKSNNRTIDMVIIHATAASSAKGTKQWFQNGAQIIEGVCGPKINGDYCRTSSHYLVDIDGGITQFVEEKDIAHHVGKYNNRSIGIEHVGIPTMKGWATEAMYKASAALVRHLAEQHPTILLDRNHIRGHNEIGSHYDPCKDPSYIGKRSCNEEYWDWVFYMQLINGVLAKESDKKEVYWIQNYKKYHVVEPEIITAMNGVPGWDWSLVEITAPGSLSRYTTGPEFANLNSNGILIRERGTTSVYRVVNGQLQYVPYRECAGEICWRDIIEVSSQVIRFFQKTPSVKITLVKGWNQVFSTLDRRIQPSEISGCEIYPQVYWQDSRREWQVSDTIYQSYLNWIWVEKECEGIIIDAAAQLQSFEFSRSGWAPISSTRSWSEIQGDCTLEDGPLYYTSPKFNPETWVKISTTTRMDPLKAYWVKVARSCRTTGAVGGTLDAIIEPIIDDTVPPLEPTRNFLVCAAGPDKIIDDLEIVEILNAWQKQRDYKGCGVPTDDDYMRALALWIKRQPVDDVEGLACQADPKIIIADPSKPQGERFLGKGVGFSPNNQAILHLQNQYGQEILTQIFDTNPEGKFLIRIENTNLPLGTYSVWFEDKCSRKRSNAESLTVEPATPNRLPVVTLTYWPENPTPDDTVNFEARASDPDGDPLTYEWYLNGVKQTMATAASVQWARPTEGNHTMTVKVFDNKGGKGEASVTFTVQKKRSQAPQITSVGIPDKITINTPTSWQLSFYDPEGDVNWIRFEQLVNSNWVSAGEWDPQVSGQTRGTIGIKTTCNSLGTVFGRVLLKDVAGNSSSYYEYSYQCVSDEFPPPPKEIILRARYKSECPVCVGDYCYNFSSVKCVVFAWQYEATDVLLFEIKSMYTDSSGYSETLNRVNPVIKEYTEMLTEDKKVCVQVRAQTSSGYTDWSNKVCATVYAITPSSRWQPELSSKVIMAKIQIFTLGGQLVYSTDFGDPKRLEWDLKDYRNLPIANGVYLVVITTNDIYGLVHREVKKIFVLR